MFVSDLLSLECIDFRRLPKQPVCRTVVNVQGVCSLLPGPCDQVVVAGPGVCGRDTVRRNRGRKATLTRLVFRRQVPYRKGTPSPPNATTRAFTTTRREDGKMADDEGFVSSHTTAQSTPRLHLFCPSAVSAFPVFPAARH